jgi:putative membrane protein
MVQYNPKNWFGLIFQFHKSDTFRKLAGMMFLIALFSYGVAYVEIEVLKMKFKTTSIIHSLLGFVISLLLVFRTNTAYERWWEGRKLWGNLLNNSRNIAIKLNAYLDKTDVQERKQLSDLLAQFADALHKHLVYKIGQPHIELNDDEPAHKPNFMASKIFERVNNLHVKGVINGYQLMVINNEIQSLTDITGACERIKKTPIPFSYSIFIKKFLFIYIMTMPFSFVTDFGYWIILITVLVFYVLVSLEIIAEEIEDPFGNDANDLPLGAISENIRKSCNEILHVE